MVAYHVDDLLQNGMILLIIYEPWEKIREIEVMGHQCKDILNLGTLIFCHYYGGINYIKYRH